MASAPEQTKRLRPPSGQDSDPLTTEEGEDADERRRQREDLVQRMLQETPRLYPDLLTKTTFVPPVHVNKLALSAVPESAAQRQDPTKLSDFRDDRAQLTVERQLWGLAEKRNHRDVMLVVNKFNLDHYLNKRLSGAPVRKGKKARDADPQARSLYPTPETPLERGEFDLLIMHKDYGFLIVEIKAIGDTDTEKPLEDLLGEGEIHQALQQLNRRQTQLEIITSDLSKQGSQIPMMKIAAFPHVTREKLREVMTNPNYSSFLSDEQTKYLEKDQDVDKALEFWLCKDEVMDPVTSEGTSDDVIMAWWEAVLKRMSSSGNGDFHGIQDDVYKELTARLCGTMSTVEVWRRGRQEIHEARDLADATHVMSTWCRRWILRPQQLEWYRSCLPFVYLTGPPGSGKTMLLELKAEERVRQDDTLVVVVRGPGNLPGHLISQLLRDQIRAAFQGEDDHLRRVLLETIDAWTDPGEFLAAMKGRAKDLGVSKIMFLVDELWLAGPSKKISNTLKDMVALLDTCRKDAESMFSATSSGEAKPDSARASTTSSVDSPMVDLDSSKPSGTSPQGASAGEAQEGSTYGKILEALKKIPEKMLKLHTTPDLAKGLLTKDVVEEETKLLSLVKQVQKIFNERGAATSQIKEADISAQVLKTVLDAQFYLDVVTSWMTSPVLHEVMQEARRHDDVALWCTGFWRDRCPKGYELGYLPESIRCPCYIQELLDRTESLASHQDTKQHVYHHTSTRLNPPLPAEAPPSCMVTPVNHGQHVTPNTCVSHCLQCGDQLATLLLETLRIGSEGSKLDFCDVLVVGRALLPIKPDSALVDRLRERGIPVSVVVNGSDDLLPENGLQANTVLVANTYNGHGLERPVVVFVPEIRYCGGGGGGGDGGGGGGGGGEGRDGGGGEGRGGGYMETLGQINEMGLWFIASRTLATLIVFHV